MMIQPVVCHSPLGAFVKEHQKAHKFSLINENFMFNVL